MITADDARAALKVSEKTTAGVDAGPRESVALARRFFCPLGHEGTLAMAQVRAGSTDPVLVKLVAALWDNAAWGEFFGGRRR